MQLLRKASKILYSMTYTKNEFTNEPKHILQHKALLARRIIRLITGQDMETGEIIRQQFSRIDSRNSQISNPSDVSGANSASINEQYMLNKSLRESILDEISSYQSSHEENPFIKQSVEIAKNQLRNVFSSGVYVPSYLCSQPRFYEDSKQLPQLINKNQHIEDSRLRFSQNQNILESYKKLAFCPTYLITRQIFKKIVIERKYFLITGVSGVGKTYSFVLYKILSEMIFQYLHFMRLKELNQQISKQLKHRLYKVPKVAFWCINEVQINKDKIQRNIINQLYQIKSQLPTMIFPEYSKKQLMDIYMEKFGMSLHMLVDELHTMTNIQKRLKYSSNSQTSSTSKIEEQIYSKQLQKLTLLRTIIQNILYHFENIIYLSPVKIERYILQSFQLQSFPGHSQLPVKQVEFLQKSNTKEYLLDFSSFIIFNFQKKFLKYNQETFGSKQLNQTQSEVLNSFGSYLRENNVLEQFYFGFLQNIAQKIQQINVNDIINSVKQRKIPQFIFNIIYQAQILSQQSFSQKIAFFLNVKGDKNLEKQRKLLMLKIFLMAKKETDLTENNSLNKNNHQTLKNIIIKFKRNSDKKIINLQQSCTNQLFDRITPDNYRCLVPKKILIKVLSKLEIQLWQNFFLFEQSFSSLFEDPKLENTFILHIFTKLLSIKSTLLSMNNIVRMKQNQLKPQENQKLSQNKKRLIRCFSLPHKMSEKTMFFYPIPNITQHRHNGYSFLKNLSNYFNLMIDKDNSKFPHESKLLLPILPGFRSKQDQISLNGMLPTYIDYQKKLIDFIIVPQLQSKYKRNIFAFKVTDSQQNEIQKQLCQFLKEFVHSTERFSTQLSTKKNIFQNVSLQYYVLVPKVQGFIDWQRIIQKSKTLIEEQIKILKDQVQNLQQSINNIEQSLRFDKQSNLVNNKRQQRFKLKEKHLQSLRFQLQKSKSLLLKSEQAILVFDQIYFDDFENLCQLSRKTQNEEERNKILLKKVGVISLCDDIKLTVVNKKDNQVFEQLFNKYKRFVKERIWRRFDN